MVGETLKATKTRRDGDPPTRAAIEQRFKDEGLGPHSWSNGPGDRYAKHSHGYHKVLYCVRGSIVFHTQERDIQLHPGDRLDIPPGVEHGATVGSERVECMEAPREERG